MRLCRFDAGAGPRHGTIEDGFIADRDDPSARHALEDVRLLAPVLPRKFLIVIDGIGELPNTVVEEPERYLAPALDAAVAEV
jgi:Domain of unknown function (DUF2437)